MFFDLEKKKIATDRKTVWHIHCGKWVLHKFKFSRESEQFRPLSAQHLDVKELTQNVHFWADIVSTLADPIMYMYPLIHQVWYHNVCF